MRCVDFLGEARNRKSDYLQTVCTNWRDVGRAIGGHLKSAPKSRNYVPRACLCVLSQLKSVAQSAWFIATSKKPKRREPRRTRGFLLLSFTGAADCLLLLAEDISHHQSPIACAIVGWFAPELPKEVSCVGQIPMLNAFVFGVKNLVYSVEPRTPSCIWRVDLCRDCCGCHWCCGS